MTLTLGKYTITLTLRKVPPPSMSIPTNSQIAETLGCTLKEAGFARAGLILQAQADAREARQKSLGIKA